MARNPEIPHQEIVNFILSGHSTREARVHFGFANDNIANLRVYAAFKRLGVPRPKYAESRICEFCGSEFIARDVRQRTCGSDECQKALIRKWSEDHPENVRNALKRYRTTEKWRQNYLRVHRRVRERGKYGSVTDRWNYAAMETKKSLRKLKYLAIRNPWEYRLQHIQKMIKIERQFTPRKLRNFSIGSNRDVFPSDKWQIAFRAIQTTLLQYSGRTQISEWEKAANRIMGALRSQGKIRQWKRSQKQSQYPSTT